MARSAQHPPTPDQPRTMVFLGAGASAADGAPVQSSLFLDYFQSAAIQDRVGIEMKNSLRAYFDGFWGIDVQSSLDTICFPTFEEALGMLDIAEARAETFRGLGDDPHSTDLRRLRHHLVALIEMLLDEKLPQQSNETTEHARLIQSLDKGGWLASTAFVSLNYDTLIDKAIELNSIRRGGQSIPDYGVEFTPRPNSNGRPFPHSNLLLKVHGSLNWLHCPVCDSLSLFPHHRLATELRDGPWLFYCKECNELQFPVLIPPTFFKAMSNFFLQQIWKRAEEELKRAERIVFCGYSFPDADLHVKYLLKRAEVNRVGIAPRVFIVNEHNGKNDEARRTEKERYSRFFRHKDEVIWMTAGFEDFAIHPEIIDDQGRWERLGPGR